MVSWFADGGVSGYNPTVGSLSGERYKLLASTGGSNSVDLNAITRLHRTVSGSTFAPQRLIGVARLRVTQADYDAANPRTPPPLGGGPMPSITARYVSATMGVAPASAFGSSVVPTPAQVWNAALTSGLLYRSGVRVEARPPAAGRDVTFRIDGPRSADLQPNTKYWMVVFASAVPEDWNRLGPHNDIAIPGRSINVDGRAISFWTNRPATAPVITSPASGGVVGAGTAVTFTYTAPDPDSISGDTSPLYTDIAGVQVQYAARPTPENPNPPWVDLPFAGTPGQPARGWYIDSGASTPESTGIFGLWYNRTGVIMCGSENPETLHGALPSGEWQIRMRTFAYGHAFPGSHFAISGAARTSSWPPVVTPANATGDLASPWSEAITINVLAQVPPPIPLSPVDGAAMTAGVPATLTWRYRNTADPPFPQAGRLVQIREVGTEEWEWVAFDTSASASVTTTFHEAGKQYEWRVQVADTDGATSNFSEIARFWGVAPPASTGTRPVPSETVDGATLGCGTHRVFVYRRGGLVRVGEIKNLSVVEYNRVRDDISDARVVIEGWDVDGGALLAQLQTWAYEIVIFRDNGFTEDRVWEGPITRLTYSNQTVTIHARDVMVYAYRRIIRQAMSDARFGDTVVSRATRVLQNTFAPDDPNVLPYLYPIADGEVARQRRSTPAYSRTAFEEVDDMASNAGLDYTTVGRAILLWGTKNRIGLLPEFRDEDFGAAPIVSEYGMGMANRYVVSDGNGVYGVADRLPESGIDEVYGLIEMLSSSWASDSEGDEGIYTQESLAKIIETFEDYAEQSISSRYPPPVVVRVPDNTTLNPGAVISIQHLVPGVAIPLRSSGTLREVRALQKLDAVRVIEEAGKETISVSMSPFSRRDDEMDETEGGDVV